MKVNELIQLAIPILVIIFLSSIGISSYSQDISHRKQNVLFIACDDLRPLLESYGCDYIRTPNIDKLSGEGTIFLKNYCQFPLCGPSRASILTGMRPDEIQIWGNSKKIRDVNPEIITLPQYFKQNGYYTVGYGKIFHDKKTDDPLSWSEPGMPVEGEDFSDYNNPITLAMLEKGRKEDPGKYKIGPPTDCADVPDNAYSDGKFADMAIQKLKDFKDSDTPFFLAVGFVRPHLPFNCPKKYWDMYDPKQIPLAENKYLPANFPDVPVYDSQWMRQHIGMPKEGGFPVSIQRHLNHGYYACVSFVDAQVGRLLDAIHKNGLDENTIIVLWGDHGYLLNDHGIYGKHTNFEIALRSPLVIRAPGYKGGVKVEKLTEFIDVYPSLSQLAGLSKPNYIQGESFVPLMKDPSQKWKSAAFSQMLSGKNMGYSMRTERYRYTKWVVRSTDEIKGIELYDYQEDPYEKSNLADVKSYQVIREKLKKQFEEEWK